MGHQLNCQQTRELLSAELDGEGTDDEAALAGAHVEHCPGCQAYLDGVHRLRRVVAMRRQPPPPDLADLVATRVVAPELGRGQWVRYALGVVAASLVLLNLPLLVGLDGSVHTDRHLGAFGTALGVGLLWAAVRPERALGLVPMAAALALAMAVGAGADVVAGRTTALTEAVHVLEAVGLALLWTLSGDGRRSIGTLADQVRRRSRGPLRSVSAG